MSEIMLLTDTIDTPLIELLASQYIVTIERKNGGIAIKLHPKLFIH